MKEMWKLREVSFLFFPFDFSLLKKKEINLVKWSLECEQEKEKDCKVVTGVLDKSCASRVVSCVCGRGLRWGEWIEGLNVKEESRISGIWRQALDWEKEVIF